MEKKRRPQKISEELSIKQPVIVAILAQEVRSKDKTVIFAK